MATSDQKPPAGDGKKLADGNWNSFSPGTTQPPPSTSGETLNFKVKVEVSHMYPNAQNLSNICYFCHQVVCV